MGGSTISDNKGSSLLASIEIGRPLEIASNWRIEPQLQLIRQSLNLNDATIAGALVQQNSYNGWIARAGVRVVGASSTDATQPYARLNVYRSSSDTDITRFIGPAGVTDIATKTGGTSRELAAGATLRLGLITSLYAEVGKMWALGGDAQTGSDINGSLGVKVLW